MSGRAASSTPPSRLLLADSDPPLRRVLHRALQARGYQVALADTASTALELVGRERPDLIILDLGLVGVVEAIRVLRRTGPTPILLLTWPIEPDPQAALDAGADDYLTKPFAIGQLLVQVQAALRRELSAKAHGKIATEHFTIDLGRRQVRTKTGEVIRLTPTEWQLVEVLVRNQGRLVTTRELLEQVWGATDNEQRSRHLSACIARIRSKLEPDPTRPRYFQADPGIGLRFHAGQTARQPQQPALHGGHTTRPSVVPPEDQVPGAKHGEQTDPAHRR